MSAGLAFEDYLAITALKARYFRAVDTHAWPALRDVFTADARFGGFGFGIREGVDTLMRVLGEQLSEVQSQHRGFTPEFAVRSPDLVRGVWAMADELHWPAGRTALADPTVPGMRGIRGTGFYEDEYTRTPAGWRISLSRLIRTRVEAIGDGDPHPLPLPGRGLDPAWLADYFDTNV